MSPAHSAHVVLMQRFAASGAGRLGAAGVHLTTSRFAVSDGCKAGLGSGRVILSSSAEPVGSIEVALAHASRLLEQRPVLAAEQAAEILKVAPGHPPAQLLLAVARR